MKFCINCKHCEKNEFGYYCQAPHYDHRINLVTGEKMNYITCQLMRELEMIGCGKDPKWFEEVGNESTTTR